MKAWFVLRWEEGVAKLRGHTRRKAPSELSYELVLEDGRWFSMPEDPREGPTFAVAWDEGSKEQRLKLAKSCFDKDGKPETVQVDPGEFGNDTKNTYVFYRGVWSGDAKEEKADQGFILKLGFGTLHFVPRAGVKDEWRVVSQKEMSKVPIWFMQDRSVEILEDEERRHFKPGTDPKIEFVKVGDTWEIRNVPIAKPGLWNGVPVTKDLLHRLVENWQLLRSTLYVPLKLGHRGKLVEAARYEKTGDPALGWVKELYYDEEDDMLRCTFTKVPTKVVEAIRKGAYTGVSMEIDPDFSGRQDVLVGVALLGADIPAITDLPRLIQIYSRKHQPYQVVCDKLVYLGGERMGDKKENRKSENSLEQLMGLAPSTILAFAKGSEPEDLDELVKAMKEKGYPSVLAKELLKLLPNPSMEQVKLMPDYDEPMWKARLEKLDERADKPEKCEDVVKELEEFLDMHGDELDDDFKKEVERVLAKAKKNMPHIEVEEEGYPKAENYPEAGVEVKKPGEGEKYPEEGVEVKEPKKGEKYPEEGVEVKEMAKQGTELLDRIVEEEEIKARTESLKQALRAKAKEAIEAKIRYFTASGLSPSVANKLREILEELDPFITKRPSRSKLQNLVLDLVLQQPLELKTFSRITPPDVKVEEDMSSIILKASPKGRARRK